MGTKGTNKIQRSHHQTGTKGPFKIQRSHHQTGPKGPFKIQKSHHQTGPKGPFKNKDRTTRRVQKDQIKFVFFCFLNCLPLISVTYDIVSHSALDKLAYLLLHSVQHTRHIGPKESKIKIVLPNGSKKGPNKIQRSHHQTGSKGPNKIQRSHYQTGPKGPFKIKIASPNGSKGTI